MSRLLDINLLAANKIDEHRLEIAERTTELQYARFPEFASRFGDVGRYKCRDDALYHLTYLARSVQTGSHILFIDYLAWLRILLHRLGIGAEDLAANLEALAQAVEEILQSDAAPVLACLHVAIERLPDLSVESESTFLEPLARRYLDALLRGDRDTAGTQINNAVATGMSVRDIYVNVFEPCQYEVGRLWQIKQISVAQEHYCTAATQLMMSELYQHFLGQSGDCGYKFIGICVENELHEIGLRMVSDMLEMDGWDTIYLGANITIDDLLDTLREHRPDVLGVSVTMTFHIDRVIKLIQMIRADDLLAGVRVIVGGYLFNVDIDLWQRIGADGYARNAEEAVTQANQLMAVRK